ncbi:MAG: 6-pyruvoyl trahydropterin synthase family protein [Planctomycetota bacterium]
MELQHQVEFCAAHRLARAEWSEQRNREVFGICANPNGHGHNYLLRVTVSGEVDVETGMVMDFLALSGLVKERILDKVDHRNLELDVPFLNGILTTAENLLKVFWEELQDGLPAGVTLQTLWLQESRDYSCTYTGPTHD